MVACWTSTAPAVTIAAAARPAPSLGRDRAEADLQRGAGAGRTRAGRGGAGAGGGGGGADVRDEQLLEQQQRPDREQGGERLVVAAQVLAEVGAAVAGAQVAADGRGRALRPSATSPSSIRTSSQESRRASAASARDTRARTSSDFTDGTVVSIASAICSYDSASISRSSSAVRCVSGRSCTSAIRSRNSSRLCTLSAVVSPPSDKWMSIESMPHRLRAAQVVERAVARDPVQPRAHVDLAVVREHRVEGGREDLLQHVLGVLPG